MNHPEIYFKDENHLLEKDVKIVSEKGSFIKNYLIIPHEENNSKKYALEILKANFNIFPNINDVADENIIIDSAVFNPVGASIKELKENDLCDITEKLFLNKGEKMNFSASGNLDFAYMHMLKGRIKHDKHHYAIDLFQVLKKGMPKYACIGYKSKKSLLNGTSVINGFVMSPILLAFDSVDGYATNLFANLPEDKKTYLNDSKEFNELFLKIK